MLDELSRRVGEHGTRLLASGHKRVVGSSQAASTSPRRTCSFSSPLQKNVAPIVLGKQLSRSPVNLEPWSLVISSNVAVVFCAHFRRQGRLWGIACLFIIACRLIGERAESFLSTQAQRLAVKRSD